MSDYISRQRLIGTLESFIQYLPVGIETQYVEALKAAVELAKLEPAVDVAPVRHGKWRERRFSEDVYGAECSVCHTTWDTVTSFCPFCGADMREES